MMLADVDGTPDDVVIANAVLAGWRIVPAHRLQSQDARHYELIGTDGMCYGLFADRVKAARIALFVMETETNVGQ